MIIKKSHEHLVNIIKLRHCIHVGTCYMYAPTTEQLFSLNNSIYDHGTVPNIDHVTW